MDGDDKVYELSHVEGPRGGVVECWDLHVGATLKLLGKSTTLKQVSMVLLHAKQVFLILPISISPAKASALTQQWIETHARRLRHVAEKLQVELNKYERIRSDKGLRFQRQKTKLEEVPVSAMDLGTDGQCISSASIRAAPT